MDPLNLSVPAQHDYNDPTVETDPSRLAEWVSDLPLMNMVETVRLIRGALDALNEQQLAAELRFRCLEAYRPAVQRMFEALDPLHIRQISMSRGQRRDTIAGAANLFSSIASGYKLVAMELQGHDEPLFGQVINRSVETLGYMLLDCYRFYRTVSPVLISDLHQLYRTARHADLLDISMPAIGGQPGPQTAVLYKYSMLLSLIDAGRLAEGEVSLLADVLREHAYRCRIMQGNNWASDGKGLFLLDLASDVMPRPCAELAPPVEAAAPFLLDAVDLLKAVREQLAHTPERVRQRCPEAIVLLHLLPGEKGPDLRREQRHRDERWVGMLLGLEHIHAHLLQTSGKHSVDAHPEGDKPADCRVLDSSENGMKLYWEQGAAGDARVGDLLGIIEGEAEQQTLLLATIRSLQMLEESGMETGVQMIASGFGAVYCKQPGQPEAGAVPALFLSADEEADIAATLIAASGLYEEGRALDIDVGGREIHVRAGRLISETPVFDRFEFSAEQD